MSLSTLAWLHQQSGQQGSGSLFGLSHDERYRRLSKSTLQNYGLPSVGSASVFSSGNVGSLLMLFGTAASWLSTTQYTGMYQQIGNPRNSGETREEDVASNLHATSGLLVGTNRGGHWEARVSLRQQLLSEWISTIDGELSGSQAKRDGEPVMTWEMFPESMLNQNRMYLRIRQNLRIEIDFWPDYDAWMQYHVYLYVNGSGNIRGHVARSAYWVEGGVKASSIGDELWPKVLEGRDTINDQLNEMLGDFDTYNFQDLYYLPGNQTLEGVSGLDGSDMGGGISLVTGGAPDAMGLTTDDVTLVLEMPVST